MNRLIANYWQAKKQLQSIDYFATCMEIESIISARSGRSTGESPLQTAGFLGAQNAPERQKKPEHLRLTTVCFLFPSASDMHDRQNSENDRFRTLERVLSSASQQCQCGMRPRALYRQRLQQETAHTNVVAKIVRDHHGRHHQHLNEKCAGLRVAIQSVLVVVCGEQPGAECLLFVIILFSSATSQ